METLYLKQQKISWQTGNGTRMILACFFSASNIGERLHRKKVFTSKTNILLTYLINNVNVLSFSVIWQRKNQYLKCYFEHPIVVLHWRTVSNSKKLLLLLKNSPSKLNTPACNEVGPGFRKQTSTQRSLCGPPNTLTGMQVCLFCVFVGGYFVWNAHISKLPTI